MEIAISPSALDWLKRELNLRTGDLVRLYVKYGGGGGPIPGFSLGISKDNPKEVGISTVTDGITFYMEEQDLWYLDQHDVLLETDVFEGDIEFIYRSLP